MLTPRTLTLRATSIVGFVIEQLIAALQTRDAYYWATQSGAELDLMVPTSSLWESYYRPPTVMNNSADPWAAGACTSWWCRHA